MKRFLIITALSLSLFALVGSTLVYAAHIRVGGQSGSGTTGGTDGSGVTGGTGGSGTTGGTGGSGTSNVSIKISNPFKYGDSLFDLMKAIVDKIILPLGAVVCVLAFIYAGFKYVMARGDPKAIGEAHTILLNAVIGTAILLGSWTIASVIEGTIAQIRN